MREREVRERVKIWRYGRENMRERVRVCACERERENVCVRYRVNIWERWEGNSMREK